MGNRPSCEQDCKSLLNPDEKDVCAAQRSARNPLVGNVGSIRPAGHDRFVEQLEQEEDVGEDVEDAAQHGIMFRLYDALVEQSDHFAPDTCVTISREVFLQYFNLPGDCATTLFEYFDVEKRGFIDFRFFVNELMKFCDLDLMDQLQTLFLVFCTEPNGIGDASEVSVNRERLRYLLEILTLTPCVHPSSIVPDEGGRCHLRTGKCNLTDHAGGEEEEKSRKLVAEKLVRSAFQHCSLTEDGLVTFEAFRQWAESQPEVLQNLEAAIAVQLWSRPVRSPTNRDSVPPPQKEPGVPDATSRMDRSTLFPSPPPSPAGSTETQAAAARQQSAAERSRHFPDNRHGWLLMATSEDADPDQPVKPTPENPVELAWVYVVVRTRVLYIFRSALDIAPFRVFFLEGSPVETESCLPPGLYTVTQPPIVSPANLSFGLQEEEEDGTGGEPGSRQVTAPSSPSLVSAAASLSPGPLSELTDFTLNGPAQPSPEAREQHFFGHTPRQELEELHGMRIVVCPRRLQQQDGRSQSQRRFSTSSTPLPLSEADAQSEMSEPANTRPGRPGPRGRRDLDAPVRLWSWCRRDAEAWVRQLRRHARTIPLTELYNVGRRIGQGSFSVVYLATSKADTTGSGRESAGDSDLEMNCFGNGRADDSAETEASRVSSPSVSPRRSGARRSRQGGNRYAIKVLDKSCLTKQDRERLQVELAILRLVRHPKVVSMHAVQQDCSYLHIIMPYFAGGDLHQFLRRQKPHRGRLVNELACRNVVWQLLDAVHHLHSQNIIHRDIKPENVFVVNPNDPLCRDVVLGDFGLSGFAHPNILMKEVVGTFAYLSPEVLRGTGYTQAVDLWGLGMVAWLCFSGTLPFQGKDRVELVQAILTQDLSFEDPSPPAETMSSDPASLSSSSNSDDPGDPPPPSYSFSWSRVSPAAKGFLSGLLCRSPSDRWSAEVARTHSWFSIPLGHASQDSVQHYRPFDLLPDTAVSHSRANGLNSLSRNGHISSSGASTSDERRSASPQQDFLPPGDRAELLARSVPSSSSPFLSQIQSSPRGGTFGPETMPGRSHSSTPPATGSGGAFTSASMAVSTPNGRLSSRSGGMEVLQSRSLSSQPWLLQQPDISDEPPRWEDSAEGEFDFSLGDSSSDHPMRADEEDPAQYWLEGMQSSLENEADQDKYVWREPSQKTWDLDALLNR